MYGKFFDPAEKATVFYVSGESESVGRRHSVIPQAEILGGGSSTNFMVYTRAAASDYDDWETEGWMFGDLLPLFKKVQSLLSEVNCRLRRITSQRGEIRMGMMGPSMFPGADRRVRWRINSSRRQKPFTEWTLSSMHRISRP